MPVPVISIVKIIDLGTVHMEYFCLTEAFFILAVGILQQGLPKTETVIKSDHILFCVGV